METNLKRKIPFGKKVGYSFGGATDTLAYDFVALFLMFFMTDMAGINPAVAGTIISLGVIWDVITDPIIGALSDKTNTRFGKKRTWLLVAMPALLISYCLLFTDLGFTGGAQTAYFVILSMAFWTAYTCFSVPYYSMGASMTMDNDERTKIRMLGMIIQYVGIFFSNVAPTMLVTVLLNSGMDTYQAWHITAWVAAALCVGTLAVVFVSTKGIELDIETKQEEKRANFFKEAVEALKIKPYLILVIMNIFYRVGYCLVITLMTYYILYSVGLSTGQMSVATFVISFGGIVVVSVLMKFVGKFDKIKIFVVLNIITGAAMIIAHFLNIASLGALVVLFVFYLLGSACYWSMNMPMMYDTVEVDEFQSGYRKEGTMFSIYLCVQKVGYAIAASVIGQVLARVGYDDTLGAANPEPVLNAISAMFCIGSGVCFIIAALIMLAYPLKADVYEKLYAQLEKKRAGEEYNTEGFAHVLSKKYR
ncbi:MAG: MFS transporter [Firmicutes bacterium]|nr:MFS transporter [Bacillota bacterium]